MSTKNILVWNVCGLNSVTHHNALCSLVATERSSVVYLQETMLSVIKDYDIVQLIGPRFDYYFLPYDQSRGGILVAWLNVVWECSTAFACRFSVSTRLQHLS
jgi:hypothetical protein